MMKLLFASLIVIAACTPHQQARMNCDSTIHDRTSASYMECIREQEANLRERQTYDRSEQR